MNKSSISILLTKILALGTFLTLCATALASDSIPIKTTRIYHRLVAIENNMRLYIGWENTDRTKWEQPAAKAIALLGKLKTDLARIKQPDQDKALAATLESAADQLLNAYGDIAAKRDETIQKQLSDYVQTMNRYANQFGQATKAFRKSIESIENPETLKTQTNSKALFQNPEDLAQYQNATKLIEQKQYANAYAILQNLYKNCKTTPLKGIIIQAMVKCLQAPQNGISEPDSGTKCVTLLEDFFKQNTYSTNMDMLFLQWRTATQMWFYGSSNRSHIPYDKYFRQRYKIVKILVNEMQQNPENIIARKQLWNMLTVPVIERGGLLGNTNLIFWGQLFDDETRT